MRRSVQAAAVTAFGVVLRILRKRSGLHETFAKVWEARRDDPQGVKHAKGPVARLLAIVEKWGWAWDSRQLVLFTVRGGSTVDSSRQRLSINLDGNTRRPWWVTDIGRRLPYAI